MNDVSPASFRRSLRIIRVKKKSAFLAISTKPYKLWPGFLEPWIAVKWTDARWPAGAFGYVPTPALVAPIEFTLRLSDYAALGGHMDHVRPLASLKGNTETLQISSPPSAPGRRP